MIFWNLIDEILFYELVDILLKYFDDFVGYNFSKLLSNDTKTVDWPIVLILINWNKILKIVQKL